MLVVVVMCCVREEELNDEVELSRGRLVASQKPGPWPVRGGFSERHNFFS